MKTGEKNMNSTKTSFKQKIFLLGFGLLVAFVFAEIVLRLFPQKDPDIFTTDPVIGFRMLSGGEIDERGWRNKPGDDPYGIVALGDSMTFGAQADIDGSWPAHLSTISEKGVYNMGLAGFGPLQYSMLTDEALEREPFMIIWGLYLGNDFTDTFQLVYENQYSKEYWTPLRDEEIVKQREGEDIPSAPKNIPTIDKVKDDLSFTRKVRIFVRDHSALYLFMGRLTRTLREDIGLVESREESAEYGRIFAKNNPELSFVYDSDTLNTVFIPGHYITEVNTDDVRVKEGLRLSLDAITQGNIRLREEGIDFAIVLIPTKDSAYREIVERDNIDAPDSYYQHMEYEDELRSIVLEHCIQQSIACLDLRPALSDALLQGRTIYPTYHDGHPISAGYKVIARDIYDNIITNE